MAIFRRELR